MAPATTKAQLNRDKAKNETINYLKNCYRTRKLLQVQGQGRAMKNLNPSLLSSKGPLDDSLNQRSTKSFGASLQLPDKTFISHVRVEE